MAMKGWDEKALERNLSGGKSETKPIEIIVEKVADDHYATLHEQRCSLMLSYLEEHGCLPPGARVVMRSDFLASVYWQHDQVKLKLIAE